MCELILPDIWSFLWNFVDENGEKIRISFVEYPVCRTTLFLYP